jgi:hypothetical protein
MGLFDLAAPLLTAVDHALSLIFPSGLRLVLWGVVSGWLTMLLFRKFSRQEAIAELKQKQKKLQQEIARFEGEFNELMPTVRQAFSLGFRQLGLSLGPALLATVPILFIVAWVAGTFVYDTPAPGDAVTATVEPEKGELSWSDNADALADDAGWTLRWPQAGESVSLLRDGEPTMELSDSEIHGVIHKKRWWNLLFGNPAGYLPDTAAADIVMIELPEHQYLPFGPDWLRGWMFVFFGTFLAASVAFKFLLKIE